MIEAQLLTLFMAAMVAFGVGMYVFLDGFDLGVGILFLFGENHDQRDRMMNSIAPFWDGNETWLVFGGAILLSAFPLAFSVILPAVYLPVIVMLLGLIFRGVAFEFRFLHVQRTRRWDWAFSAGSIVATFSQGVVLGAFVQGVKVQDGRYAGGPRDWLSSFSMLTGAALVCGYALLGATWLAWRTHGDLQRRSRYWIRPLLMGLLATMAAVSVWRPLMSPRIEARWFSLRGVIALLPVPLLSVACAWRVARTALKVGSVLPFVFSIGLFFLSYTGLAISIFPLLPPPALSLFEAAASPKTQLFLLPGLLVLVPLILWRTWLNYRVFQHQSDEDPGYGHG